MPAVAGTMTSRMGGWAYEVLIQKKSVLWYTINGDEGTLPTDRLIETVTEFLRMCDESDVPRPLSAPKADGTLTLYWRTEDTSVSAGFANSGLITLSTHTETSGGHAPPPFAVLKFDDLDAALRAIRIRVHRRPLAAR